MCVSRAAAAAAFEAEAEEYYSPESLDPNKPEFPKLIDPPFRCEFCPYLAHVLLIDGLHFR